MQSLWYIYLFIILVDTPIDVCNPSPCGPNSQCRVNNNQAVCSCLPIFIGSPPACRPECVTSSDCPLAFACVNQKCQDPCPGSCGRNSNCRVIKHNPICSCKNGYTGDPFTVCFQTPGMNFNFCLILFFPIHHSRSDLDISFISKILSENYLRITIQFIFPKSINA